MAMLVTASSTHAHLCQLTRQRYFLPYWKPSLKLCLRTKTGKVHCTQVSEEEEKNIREIHLILLSGTL